jgi:hypothetical protein
MSTIRRTAFCLCVLSLVSLLGTQVCFARLGTPKTYIDDKARAIVGGRKVLIVLASHNVQPTIERVPISTTTTVGVDWIYQMRQIDYEQYEKDLAAARELGAPLLASLSGYDFGQLICRDLQAIVERSSWLGAQDVEITADGSGRNLEQELNASNTRQMVVLLAESLAEYRYLAITVTVKATLLVRQIPRGKHGYVRLQEDHIPYQMTFTSISNLAGADRKNPRRNLERWAANDGKLARDAMNLGIAFATERFARNLDDSPVTNALWSKRGGRKGRLGNGRAGWVIESGEHRKVSFDAVSRALILETEIAD